MRKDNTRNIGEILRKLMKNPKLSNKLDELDALDLWKELIGDKLEKYILDVKIYRGILYVKVNSSALKNELYYEKTDLINRINQNLQKDIVKDIIFT
mgnify:CR=1 FL=1|tara:strand:+ start:344 stop:634 length:291 start_codon:yes stop_codon:yes gene_type:complete